MEKHSIIELLMWPKVLDRDYLLRLQCTVTGVLGNCERKHPDIHSYGLHFNEVGGQVLVLHAHVQSCLAADVLMVGMHEQRIRRWRDSMSYLVDLEPGLRTLNWQGNGKRLTVDKLVMAERFATTDISAAKLLAVVGRDGVEHPHGSLFSIFTDADDLAARLAAGPDRLIVKPATGWRGDGILGPERHGKEWRVDGQSFSDRTLAQHLLAKAPPSGLLVQKRIRSHRDLTPIGGALGLGTVRINTALTIAGPEVIFVFAKIMGSEGLVDNFAGGKFGNMLACVDKQSGRIQRVFGRKHDQKYLMEPINHHPVTGTPLVGFQLPQWHDALDLAKRTAVAFPEAPLIGADIALTDDGPLVIEVQSDWDANAPQLIMQQGLRPLLRDVIPRLATRPEIKQEALERMGLVGRPRRRKLVRLARA